MSADKSVSEGEAPEPPPVSFDEQFFPARPYALRHLARGQQRVQRTADQVGEPSALNPAYVAWLRNQSMLQDATLLAKALSGQGAMWQNPYGNPEPRAAVSKASVWFTAYPLSLITAPGTSFLRTLSSQSLWKAFNAIGIDAIHVGPVKEAGGITGWSRTPSIDGHFDRIGTRMDPVFGTEQEFRELCAAAAQHGGIIVDDVIPGHTGKGSDFRLAERAVDDYPGIYHMVEIRPEDWHLLPEVLTGHDSINLSLDDEGALADAGYIIGPLQRVIFYEPGVKETNWSVTEPVIGIDGTLRRWVYLHYFKEGQPSINWLDPSFAGMRLVIGDVMHSLVDMGTGGLRLDANGFLGVEKSASGLPAWSEGHPLSEAANQVIGSMVRKVGGFSFQELNLSMDDIRDTSLVGADLSYDFINRPAYQHALATGDTEFLRLTLRQSAALGIDSASLVHALQNHDELTYELVHFATVHGAQEYTYRGESVKGADLAEIIRTDLRNVLVGDGTGYNRVFTTNGIACTTVSLIAATLNFDLDALEPSQLERIKRAHLLLAMFNALQPGVFALSGWDLAGMVPIKAELIPELLGDGDTRWLHRPAHDLLGVDPGARFSRAGLPRTVSLYGPLTDQLGDPNSFASQLTGLLDLRRAGGLAVATQLDIPDVSNRGMLVLVHRLPDGHIQVTVLNFSSEPVAGSVYSEYLPPRAGVFDMASGLELADVDDLHRFGVSLGGHRGMSLRIISPPTGAA